MINISSLFNGVQRILSNFTKKRSHYGLPYTALINAFQVHNSAYFLTETNVPLDNDDIQCAAVDYQQIKSPVAAHLKNSQHITIELKNQHFRADGTSFTFIEYKLNDGKSPTTNWATFLLSKMTEEDEGISTLPHFVLTGTYQSQDGELLFMPHEVVCLIEKDGQLQHYRPELPAEMSSAVAYANQALTQLIAGNPLDVTANQKWFEPEKYTEAISLCLTLIKRTPDQFSKDIAASRLPALEPQV